MKKTKYMLSEGVKFRTPAFEFDFEHDGIDDIVTLSGNLKTSSVNGNTYFFQYEFSSEVSSSTRSNFIHALKFNQKLLGSANVSRFIEIALANLNRAINLASVDVIIYPQSSSSVTRDIVDKIDSFTDSERYMKVEVLKKSISEISFNWDKFEKYCEIHNVPSGAKEVMKSKMLKMLDDIHKLDYFSIARNIRGQKYKTFLNTIYKFYDDSTIKLIKTIKDKKILIVDDIYTSGVTVEQILKAYQLLDPDDSNVVTVFTLIGKSKAVKI